MHYLRFIAARLYDYHPNGNEDLLLDTMVRLKWSGVPWEDVFKKEVETHYNVWAPHR